MEDGWNAEAETDNVQLFLGKSAKFLIGGDY